MRGVEVPHLSNERQDLIDSVKAYGVVGDVQCVEVAYLAQYLIQKQRVVASSKPTVLQVQNVPASRLLYELQLPRWNVQILQQPQYQGYRR